MLDETNPDSLRSVKSNEFLPPISAWETCGGLFLFATVAVGIVLAAVIKYPVIVRTSGVVRPLGEVRIVQATTTGTVERIAVKENQQVKSGDAIAILNAWELQTKKSQILGNIQQNQRQLMQLNAQIRTLDTQTAAETNRSNRALLGANAELENTQREYEQKQQTASSDVQEAVANIQIAQDELQKAQAELKSTQAQVKATQAALEAAIVRRNRYQTIAQSGSISQNQLEEVQLAVTQQQQVLESQKAIVESQRQVVQRQQKAIAATYARQKRALAMLNPSNAVLSIAKEKIAQESAMQVVSLAKLKQEKESLLQQQAELQNQIYNAQKELRKIENELGKTIIRTTEAGTILKLELRNSGQVVSTGDAIAQIAPSKAPIIIKARVAAQDISKIQVCNQELVKNCTEGKVELRISSYPYPDYGTLSGAVRAISADTIAPITNGNNTVTPYYEVSIEPMKIYIEKDLQKYPLQPGMEVTADIISRQETVIKFIFRKARLLTD